MESVFSMNFKSKILFKILFLKVMLLIAAQPLFQVTPGKKVISIAMCQILCLDGDRSGNLVRVENALREAKKADADIACFPETTLLGWVNPEAHKKSHPIPGEDSDHLCRLASKYRIHVSIGLAEREDDRLYDSVILIDDTGEILLKHRKKNILTKLMTPPYTPGKDIGVAETRFGKIGLLICADTFKTDILKQMASLKPDLVLVPYGWAAKQEQWPEHGQELQKTVCRAARTIGAPVVGVDLVGEITHGPWTGLTYGGQSVTANAEGEIIATAKDRDREVMVVQVSIKMDEHTSRKDSF